MIVQDPANVATFASISKRLNKSEQSFRFTGQEDIFLGGRSRSSGAIWFQ